MTEILKTDTLIFGGGVAGLWLLNRLRNEGYSAWLLEHDRLGAGQSIASQGIIHSGLKYVHDGTLGKATTTIADMPEHWRQCLQGRGEVDLQACSLLSDAYYMLPNNSRRSRLLSWFGSKALASRTTRLTQDKYPGFFRNHVKRPMYRIEEFVVDVPSLLATLNDNHRDSVFSIDWHQAHLENTGAGGISGLQFSNGVRIEAHLYISCCGAGAETLMQHAELDPAPMQRRPLQQVMVRHSIADPVFVHCVSSHIDLTPELTITTHRNKTGAPVWYLGGRLAEDGAGMNANTLIDTARGKLAQLFPWCDFSKAAWGTLSIDRAEARQPDGRRPENASMVVRNNLALCWPTKLTLAPSLADRVLAHLRERELAPDASQHSPPPAFLPHPQVAATPWENL
jgi:hypothetical protein